MREKTGENGSLINIFEIYPENVLTLGFSRYIIQIVIKRA